MDFLTPTRKQLSDWAKLSQKKHRRELGQFLIEGEVCTGEALDAQLKLEAILLQSAKADEWANQFGDLRAPIYRVNSESFERITKLEASQGVVAVAKMFSLPPLKSGLAIACEQVSDPGNCGALIRVADFFGASCLYLGRDSADIWNGKVVRGSMGSLFHQPVREHCDLLDLLDEWPGESVALVSHGGTPLSSYSPPTRLGGQGGGILVLGHESRGLSDELAMKCTHRLTLERRGHAESLNLVTAAAVFANTLTATPPFKGGT
ncbi:RNA methyltransferase [candidate division KSB1 bacterium]|nr:RNA methyltransferase [candidate division KSB1 bacterium]